MWRCLACLLTVAVFAAPASAARSRAAGEDLLRVVTPTSKAVANAHPHVNVIVSFGTAKDGTAVDPETFRAKLNGRDVTELFRPVLTGAAQTGVRAALPESALRHVERPRNKLRLSAQGVRGGKGPRPRDIDRVRFGAADGANQGPTAIATAGAETARIGEPIAFDASGSHDPDGDELTFSWTFSDGGTASGPAVTHAFAAANGATVTASVDVSDAVTVTPASVTLPVALSPDPGRTAGLLRIVASEPLEFSAVAIGATAKRTLTLLNEDPTATSQVKIETVLGGGSAFTLAPQGTIDLGPGASVPLEVSFTPTVTGHAEARLMLVTSAANRSAISFVAHGFGGNAPGDGPTGVAIPIFGTLGSEITRLAPEGGGTVIDNTAGACATSSGLGTGDVCVDNGDCGTGGEVCTASGFPVDATALCSDGQSLFVLSEDSYVDPRADPETEISGTLMRFDLDASGATTGRAVLYRTTDDTSRIACDGFTGQGGLVYLAEFRVVQETNTCDRDERDTLMSVNKDTGNARPVSGFSRIDEAAGVPECAFRDPVERLEVAPDGVKKYAGFESAGLWRIAPTPQAFSPDVHESFGVHPDGSSIAAVVAVDRGTTGTIDLYRLTEAQVEHGALPLSALAPCASYTVPNNTTAAAPTTTIATSIVVAPTTLSGRDATALVTFAVRATLPLHDVLPPFGVLRGTVAFALPADGTTCSVAGLVSLQARDLAK